MDGFHLKVGIAFAHLDAAFYSGLPMVRYRFDYWLNPQPVMIGQHRGLA